MVGTGDLAKAYAFRGNSPRLLVEILLFHVWFGGICKYSTAGSRKKDGLRIK